MHELTRAVVGALAPAARREIRYACRGLDVVAEPDDVVQQLALAALAGGPRWAGLHRCRPSIWQRRRRRVPLPEVLPTPPEQRDVDLAVALVQVVGDERGALVWQWIVDGEPLSRLAAARGLTKQQVWRQAQGALAQLRAAWQEDVA